MIQLVTQAAPEVSFAILFTVADLDWKQEASNALGTSSSESNISADTGFRTTMQVLLIKAITSTPAFTL